MKMRKMTAAALAAVLTVSAPLVGMANNALSVVASAEDILTEGDYDYTVNEDGQTVIITRYNGEDAVVTIPAAIDGKAVTKIGDSAFSLCTSLKSIAIPDSVTSIGITAFRGCYVLTSVTISGSVTEIGSGAFMECQSLTSVTIPEGVTSIGDAAFNCCYSLESVTIPNSVTHIGSGAFQTCTSLKNVTIPEKVAISYSIFSGCTSLEKIEVNSNNINLCSVDGVLYNKDKTQLICYPAGKKGTAYTIPDGVTTIKEATFYGNRSLNSITIPDSVTKIERNAFQDSISLTEITIPNTVTSIEVYTFENCTSLKNVKFVGTKEEWDKVTVDEHNDSLKNAAITFTDSTTSDPTTSEPTSSDPTTSSAVPGDTDKPAEQETLDATLKNVDSKDGLSGASLEKQLFGDSGWTWGQVEKVEFTSDKLFSVQYTAADGSTKTLGETAARAENDGIWNTAWTLDTSLMSKDKPSVKLIAKDGTADITAKVYIKKDAQKPSNSDQKNTGIALAIAPIVLAASVVIVASKKRK